MIAQTKFSDFESPAKIVKFTVVAFRYTEVEPLLTYPVGLVYDWEAPFLSFLDWRVQNSKFIPA